MNNVEFIDAGDRIDNTASRALRNKEQSRKGIREKYYNWRIARKNAKMENVQSAYSMAGKVNFFYERKLKKLNKRINDLILVRDNPGNVYKVYSAVTKKVRSLALSIKNIADIKDYVKYNRLQANVVENEEEVKEEMTRDSGNEISDSTDFTINDVSEESDSKDEDLAASMENIFTGVEDNLGKINIEIPEDESSKNEGIIEEKNDTYEESKQELYQDQEVSNEELSAAIEEKVAQIDVQVPEESVDSIVEEPETIITDEEVKQDLDIPSMGTSEYSEPVNDNQSDTEIQIVPERSDKVSDENQKSWSYEKDNGIRVTVSEDGKSKAFEWDNEVEPDNRTEIEILMDSYRNLQKNVNEQSIRTKESENLVQEKARSRAEAIELLKNKNAELSEWLNRQKMQEEKNIEEANEYDDTIAAIKEMLNDDSYEDNSSFTRGGK